MELTATLVLIFLCIAMEAFFSGSEIALISSNWIKIHHSASKGDKAAQIAKNMLETPDRLFTTTSLGTNLAVVTSTAILTAYMVKQFGHYGDILTTLALTPVILLLGEIFPKVICQSTADQMILWVARPLNGFLKLFGPVVSFISFFSDFFLKTIFRQKEPGAMIIDREQIRQITSPETPTELDQTERTLIHKIFNFGEITVDQCMVPLVQIYAIRDNATLEQAHEIALHSGYSRLPVFHERMFNLIGILNTFDLLVEPSDSSAITSLIRPAYYVPPNKKIDDLLKELQQRGLHMAIVVDEFGGCVGIVTIEDILEEIVGEIEDEYDEQEEKFEAYSDGSGYLCNADVPVDFINERLSLSLPEGDYETLAGLMIDSMEKIPQAGDQISVQNYRLTVKETGKRKVHSIILRKMDPSETVNSPKNKR
tara:strand:+ start:670 stop:1944 length:1275 start_codon:yes stop_codon:yes gene_type:complete